MLNPTPARRSLLVETGQPIATFVDQPVQK